MRTKLIVGALIIGIGLALISYACLSASVGRCLRPSQFVRFSTTIASSVIHPNEGGASRAFGLYRQAMRSPTSVGSVASNGHKYTFPLPQYAIPEGDANGDLHFLAFVSRDEMNNYFYRDLPDAGWAHEQQLGAGHFFTGYGIHMTMVQHYYLTRDISEFHVSLDK